MTHSQIILSHNLGACRIPVHKPGLTHPSWLKSNSSQSSFKNETKQKNRSELAVSPPQPAEPHPGLPLCLINWSHTPSKGRLHPQGCGVQRLWHENWWRFFWLLKGPYNGCCGLPWPTQEGALPPEQSPSLVLPLAWKIAQLAAAWKLSLPH